MQCSLIEPIKMNPCPFCEGPPCLDGYDQMTREMLRDDHPHDEDSDQHYEAYVNCHDCGAQGPRIDSITLGIFEHRYDLSLMDVMRIAAERWNDRHNRARSCYDGGEKEGLNIWPRAEA